jgi:dolichyl-phosphate beta-glucosyltransferase
MRRHPIPASRELTIDAADHGTPVVSRVLAPTSISTSTPGLSVVVPIWNGAKRLPSMLESIDEFLATCALSSELVLVDDCSAAPTMRVLERALRDTREVTVLRNQRNRGKGFSVRRGMLAARGAYRVFIDADLAYLPREIAKIVDALDAGADVAIGCRGLPESRYVTSPALFGYTYARHLTSRAFNLVVRRLLLPGIIDSQAGLKGFTAAAAERIFPLVSTPGFGFDIECLYVAHARGQHVTQTPVTVQCDDHLTTLRLGGDSVRMLRDIARVRWRASHHLYDDFEEGG